MTTRKAKNALKINWLAEMCDAALYEEPLSNPYELRTEHQFTQWAFPIKLSCAYPSSNIPYE